VRNNGHHTQNTRNTYTLLLEHGYEFQQGRYQFDAFFGFFSQISLGLLVLHEQGGVCRDVAASSTLILLKPDLCSTWLISIAPYPQMLLRQIISAAERHIPLDPAVLVMG